MILFCKSKCLNSRLSSSLKMKETDGWLAKQTAKQGHFHQVMQKDYSKRILSLVIRRIELTYLLIQECSFELHGRYIFSKLVLG